MLSIILASKSKVRKEILEKNNIKCIVKPSNVNWNGMSPQERVEYLNSNTKNKQWNAHQLKHNLNIVSMYSKYIEIMDPKYIKRSSQYFRKGRNYFNRKSTLIKKSNNEIGSNVIIYLLYHQRLC